MNKHVYANMLIMFNIISHLLKKIIINGRSCHAYNQFNLAKKQV